MSQALAQNVANRWLLVLDTNMADLGEKWRSDLRGFLTNAPTSSASASTAQLAMGIVTAKDPSIQEDLKKHMDPWSAMHCFVAPLLAWGLNQPWAKDVHAESTFQKWLSLKSPNKQVGPFQEYRVATMQLGLAFEDCLPRADHAQLMTCAFNAAVATMSLDNIALKPDFAHAAVAALQAAEKSTQRTRAVSHCLGILHSMLDQLTGADSALEKRDTLFGQLAQSPVPIDIKIRMLEQNPIGWRLGDVQKAIAPVWPLPEHARAAVIPFLDSESEPAIKAFIAKQNRYVFKAYCPALYPLLELGASSDIWTNRALLLRAVDQFSNAPPETFNIPADTFDF